MSSRRTIEELTAVQSMLRQCALKVARAEANLRQEMAGFPSTTPGNGSPGGGKGGGPTVRIHDAADPVTTHHTEFVEHPDGTVERRPFSITSTDAAVPVTSVERQVLFAPPDNAAADLRQLHATVMAFADRVATVADLEGLPVDYHRRPGDRLTTMLVRAFGAVTELLQLDPPTTHLVGCRSTVNRIYNIVHRWSYTPDRPAVHKDVAELLAVDLTEQWCTSHLRLGVKRQRYRGELCQWCVRTVGLVPTWQAPPLELVRIHVEQGKVYKHQFEKFERAERDRQRNLNKRSGQR